MTIGDKIKRIRTFRKMTQAELGAALGWGDKGANRLAQYETRFDYGNGKNTGRESMDVI